MDVFLPLETIDTSFERNYFFLLEYEKSKKYLIDYLRLLINGKTPNNFVSLFDELSESPLPAVMELYEKFNSGSRQCQRSFLKHFGITLQKVLSILRFQYCADKLISKKSKPNGILGYADFYDQSHFIKDFKNNIGMTPVECLRKLSE